MVIDVSLNTSGTYSFAPSLGELVLNSYARCGVHRPQITPEHMTDARIEANMVLVEFSNRQVNLWEVDLLTIPLIQGISTYSVPPETVALLDVYIETSSGTSPPQPNDTYMLPISRTEYASFPDKVTQAKPTVYWFDRLIAPTITVWQPPDNNGPYLLRYYRVRQTQDANLQGGQNVEVPYRWLKVFRDKLAAALAVAYAPDRATALDTYAERSWEQAAGEDHEDVPMYIYPSLNGYFRI